jgi:hypothetical protein
MKRAREIVAGTERQNGHCGLISVAEVDLIDRTEHPTDSAVASTNDYFKVWPIFVLSESENLSILSFEFFN